jgi:hypothetical protein
MRRSAGLLEPAACGLNILSEPSSAKSPRKRSDFDLYFMGGLAESCGTMAP